MEGKRLKFKGKDGKSYSIFVDKITYYRSYIENSEKVGETSSMKTSVYLVGSTKALTFPISYPDFDKKIDAFYEKK